MSDEIDCRKEKNPELKLIFRMKT